MPKIKVPDKRSYDAFLSHNSLDKPVVKEIGAWLEDEKGLKVWLDEWNLVPGDPWQVEIERALDESRCCIVFLGTKDIGPWQNEEMRVALANRVEGEGFRVLPVLLPGARMPARKSELPAFLRQLTWVEFAKNWNEEVGLHRLICGIRGLPPGRSPESEAGESSEINPYRGLAVFRFEDQRFFFGREGTIQDLHGFLQERRFLALTGPSGSGKSSVIQAGLLPRLVEDGGIFTILTPQERPLEELSFALRKCFAKGEKPAPERLVERLESRESSLHLIGREVVEARNAKRLFVVVDQFEELFTQANAAERRPFLRLLLHAADISGPVTVILTMRSDFLGHVAVDPDLNVFFTEHLKQVGPMRIDELEAAIVGPAEFAGLALEDGLVEEIIKDVAKAPGELPLLQHALLELYLRREGKRLTLRGYREIGRIEGALARRAEDEFGMLDSTRQEVLRKMFVLCLVTPGDGTEDTRRRAKRSELISVGSDSGRAEEIVDRWTNARLLTAAQEEDGREALVDVAHEALIRKWTRLRSWLDEGREMARQIDTLRRAAREWNRSRGHSDYFLRGVKLGRAEEVVDRHGADLTDLERSFVKNSRRRARRRSQAISVAILVALVLAGYLVLEAQENERAALNQLSISYWAEARQTRADGDILKFVHLASQSIEVARDKSLQKNQMRDLEAFRPRWGLRQLYGQETEGAVFSRDGLRILTWSLDGTAQLWDVQTGEPISPLIAHRDKIYEARFNRDEKRVLTRSADGTARLSLIETGELVGQPLSHEGAVWGAVFSRDESTILTWSADGTARLWNAQTGAPLGSPLRHKETVRGALFNKDESKILTWSYDHTARLWNSKTGESLCPPLRHEDTVRGAVFSGDENTILTWSDDHSARLWDTETGEPTESEFKHRDAVNGAVFSKDDEWVLTWSQDGTAQLWDATTSDSDLTITHERAIWGALFSEDESRILTWGLGDTAKLSNEFDEQIGEFKHREAISEAVFLQDEKRILTRSRDRTVRVWDAETGDQVGPPLLHSEMVDGAILSPGEDQILTWNRYGEPDGLARLWTADKGTTLSRELPTEDLAGAVFSRDGSRILTWSSDGSSQVLDVETGNPIGPSFAHQGLIWGAAFSEDESRILTWSNDRSARVWDSETGRSIGKALQHQASVDGARFNRDETKILTWSRDGTARLWDSKTGRPIGQILTHEGAVDGAIFSRDERKIVTWGSDATARVWNARTGEAKSPLLEHSDDVGGAVFSLDESNILTWSFDSTAQVWETETGELLLSFELIRESQDEITGAIFNRVGSRILSWSEDSKAQLWDTITGEPIGRLLEHENLIKGAVFSQDEKRILTWSDDNTAQLWESETGEPIGRPLTHQDGVDSAIFSWDESRILTLGNRTARLWDVGSDFDLPAELMLLQIQTLTGSESKSVQGEIRPLNPDSWRQKKAEWEEKSRAHFKVCRYPRYNVWRRFNPDEAREIRPELFN